MKAIILCAGYATRLYPLTEKQPKALLPIGKKPLLSYITKQLEPIKEISEIYIISNNKFYKNFLEWKSSIQEKTKKPIEILNNGENGPEGGLGGLDNLWFGIKKTGMDKDVLAILGDNLFRLNVQEMIGFSSKMNETILGVCKLKEKKELQKMGVIETKEGIITSFKISPKEPKSNLASTGLYIFPKKYFKDIEKYMGSTESKDGPGRLIIHFYPKKKVYAFVLKGKWHDIGTVEMYNKVKKSWK